MQVRDRRTGQMVELPDEYDDDQILGHFSAQGQQAPSLAQSFIGGIQQQAGSQIAQQLAQGPAQSTLPNIGGGAMVGLTPQQAQFTLQSAQNANVDAMANKMQQQQMVQNKIESEADRAQTLKLRQQELKNIIQERKIVADQAKFEAKKKADLEMLKENNASAETLAEIGKPVNVSEGGALVKDGLEIYKNPKTYAPDKPREPSASDWEFQDKEDPATGKAMRYRVNLLTGEEQLFGPVPSITSKRQGSSSGGRDDLSVSDSEKVLNRFDEQILKEPGYDTKNPDPAIEQKVLRRVRRELNVSAFPTDSDATEFINARAEALFQQEAANWPPEALNNEATVSFLQKKAMDQAEQERWEEDGYETRGRNKDGELIVLTPNGEDPRR